MKSIKELEQIRAKGMADLLEFFGTKRRLAQATDNSDQTVCNWYRRGKIPKLAAAKIEQVTAGKITKWQLRPDVIVWGS